MTSGHRPSRTAQHPTRRLGRPGLTLALVATLLTAGCGGSDGDPSTPVTDQTAPTVVITDSTTAATAAGDVTFSFTFTEDVGQSFAAADVTLSGGTKGAFTRLSSTVYRLVTTPDADSLGTLAVSVPAGAFADLAGNVNTAAATASQAYDTRSVLTQMTLPVTFDVATQDYGLVGFGGADASTVVLDPSGSATNHVARVVKSAAAETWAGTTITKADQLGFATAIPFDASNTRMSVRVWSPDAGVKVRLKVEDHASAGTSVETEATTSVANGWETLTFDFANPASGTAALNVARTFDKASIFFNFGVAGATAGEKTYYFDDVVFVGGGGLPAAVPMFEPVDFESTATSYTLTPFEGVSEATIVLDPSGSSTNHVVRVVKSATAQPWAGTTISSLAGNRIGKIAFDATHTRMTVRVWSPDAGITVRLKVEDATDNTVTVETDATTTVANGWEYLTFDFATQASGTAALNVARTYDRLSIFFNFGVSGATAGEKTYHLDEIGFVP